MKEVKLPPLRKAILNELPQNDAAFTLTSSHTSRSRQTSRATPKKKKRIGRKKKLVGRVKVKQYVHASHFLYDDETKEAISCLLLENKISLAALLRALIRQEYKRLKEKNSV